MNRIVIGIPVLIILIINCGDDLSYVEDEDIPGVDDSVIVFDIEADLVYASGGRILFFDKDSSTTKTLLPSSTIPIPSSNKYPTWSNDGQKFYYLGGVFGNFYEYSLLDSSRNMLFSDHINVYRINPEGSMALYYGYNEGDYEIFLHNFSDSSNYNLNIVIENFEMDSNIDYSWVNYVYTLRWRGQNQFDIFCKYIKRFLGDSGEITNNYYKMEYLNGDIQIKSRDVYDTGVFTAFDSLFARGSSDGFSIINKENGDSTHFNQTAGDPLYADFSPSLRWLYIKHYTQTPWWNEDITLYDRISGEGKRAFPGAVATTDISFSTSENQYATSSWLSGTRHTIYVFQAGNGVPIRISESEDYDYSPSFRPN